MSGRLGAESRVVINEIHFHPGDDSREGEFVEIHNDGAGEVDLSGWRLGGAVSLEFAPGTRLAPGAFGVVGPGLDPLLERYPALDPSTYLGNFVGSLENQGEQLWLETADGYVVSSLVYGDSDPWPETPDGLGPSLERVSPRREDDDPKAWLASVLPGGTPGEANSAAIAEPPASEELSWIAAGATWRYFKGTEDPPAGWRDLGFEDGGWSSGASGFGFGDGDDATALTDMQNRYLTVFIRREFTLSGAADFIRLNLSVDYDDGFVAWLNGVEIARANVAGTGFDDPATASHEAGFAEVFPYTSLAGVLREGTNVLAMQGHNQRLDSPDLSLAPRLSATRQRPGSGGGPLTRPARDLVINEVFTGGAGSGWVELFNPGDAALDASGRRLQEFPVAAGDAALPAGSVIAPRGQLALAESALGFELEAVHALILATADGRFIDALNPRAAPAAHSSGRFPDGAESRHVFPNPTRGAANQLVLEDAVLINEIMYHPAPESPGTEYLELHNRSGRVVSLAGWSFTRGIEHSFPPGTTIGPGGYLVLAANPAALIARYEIAPVLVQGPFVGGLRNDAETLLLRDALGNPVDRVRFADEGSWPAGADGLGPSAELAHPALENRYGPAWRASASAAGSPGAANASFELDPSPVVAEINHSPLVPSPTQKVRVLARVSDAQPLSAVRLFYRVDGGAGPQSLAMADDGVADDRLAGNGVYGAELPARNARTIVGYWIEASSGAQLTRAPASAPGAPFLYQVEDPSPDSPRPLYRLIMLAADLNELRNRAVFSNELLNATLVDGERAYQNRGIRLRGNGARNCFPRSYRVQLDHDNDLHGIKRLNLNGCNPDRQWVGLDFLRRTAIATPQCWFRNVAFNGELENGLHLRVEAMDAEFLERNFPEDDGGNLYRGNGQANLDYRGGDFDDYRSNYAKLTNEEADDYSDVVALTRVFDPAQTPNAEFPAALEAAVDVDEWALYFAAYAVLCSTENSILLDNGDDYHLYHRPSDGRWILLPWDLDSVFNEPEQRLFRPTVDAIERYLKSRRYAPDYWCHLEEELRASLPVERSVDRVSHLDGLFSAGAVAGLKGFPQERLDYVLPRLHAELSVVVESGGSICQGTLVVSGASVSLRGSAPGCGTSQVTLNGAAASYDPLVAEWSATLETAGLTSLEIVASYRDGSETARLELSVQRSGQTTPLASTISSSTTLTRARSPYRAAGDVQVGASATLTLEPGVIVLMPAASTLRVAGALVAQGSAELPVTFRRDACGSGWKGIVFQPGSRGNVLSHVALEDSSAVDGADAPLLVDGGELRVDALRVPSASGVAILARRGGALEASDLDWRDGGAGAIRFEGAGGSLRDCRFERFAGAAVEARGAGPALVISGCVLREVGAAVAIEDGAHAAIDHVTVYGCEVGLRLRQASAGAGGGRIDAHSLIVWSAASAVSVDASSTLLLSYSATAGGTLPGTRNLSADPLFVEPAVGDLRLTLRSPCRASGLGGTDMGAIPYVPTGARNRFRRGDANGDGTIDIGDALTALFTIFQARLAPPCLEALDFDGQEGVDLGDAIGILRYLFAGALGPAPPFPDCDSAPEEDCFAPTCL